MQNRILSCPIPTNVNPLSPNGYMFNIQRIPSLSYFCQEASIPNVDLGIVNISSPFAEYPLPGDILNFGELNVQFLIDSDMANYKALFNWIQGLGFPEDYAQYTAQVDKSMPGRGETPSTLSDATLTVLGNNNLPVQYIKFIDCVPVSLSSLTFTSTSQDVQYLIGNASFRYSYFKFES